MRNTIVIDRTMNNLSSLEKATASMQKAAASLIAARGTDGKSKYQAILESLKERYADAENKATAEETGEMALPEYKEYIKNQIEGLPMADSRDRDTITIDMTDECFVHMRDDPTYEKWVMDSIRSAFLTENKSSKMFGGSYMMLRFGRERGDYTAETWGKNSIEMMDMFSAKSETRNSFWNKRMTEMRNDLMAATMMNAQKAKLESAIASYNAAANMANSPGSIASDARAASALIDSLKSTGESSYTSILSSLTGDYLTKGTSLTASYLMTLLGGGTAL
ncbi:MAG: hypothetical protein IJT82_05495 [Schwartzia sp.]|nr:hypothetical protein [Schwartzia sp. (in: firmicutes)]